MDVKRTDDGAPADLAMIEALAAAGPYAPLREKLMVFGRLIGSWDIVGRAIDPDGNVVRETTGEWHFGWVLEGRVIQDVIISPPRAGREPGVESKAYDAAIRVYDPVMDAWRVTVIAPIYRASLNLIAREHGDEIWLEGPGPESDPVRWTFSEFSDTRVRWQGYVSRDGGETWVRDEEIILTRPGPTTSQPRPPTRTSGTRRASSRSHDAARE